MFFTIPPAEPWELGTPEHLKSVTLRIDAIQPGGHVNVYYTPFPGLPARFDAEHPEHQLPATSGIVYLQKMEGAESFKLAVVGFERDPEAEERASGPQPIHMLRR